MTQICLSLYLSIDEFGVGVLFVRGVGAGTHFAGAAPGCLQLVQYFIVFNTGK